jgi:type II secretory pathway pseudopilin PulG
MKLRRTGFSLIEVVVAAMALVILLVPLLITFSSTLRTTEVSIQELQAQQLALEFIEQVKVLALSVGFENIQERPYPNLPLVLRPKYMGMEIKDEFPLMGSTHATTCDWDDGGEVFPPLSTKTWTITGRHMCFCPTDPSLAEKSRFFLSPLPDGFKRYVQIFIPVYSESGNSVESNLIKARVKIMWKSKRTDKDTKPMEYILTCLISNRRKWGI